MGYTPKLAAALAAGALLAGSPASAMSEVEAATKLRELDMMLMVTSLRCRFGTDDFQADYDAFRTRHGASLGDAALLVMGDMAQRIGRDGAIETYDRMSTAMANAYGLGHPRLSCAELKPAAATLSHESGRDNLLVAAEALLENGSGQAAPVKLAAGEPLVGDTAEAGPILIAQR